MLEFYYIYPVIKVMSTSYQVSTVSGGQRPIYNFPAPREYLEDPLFNSARGHLLTYLLGLYPLTTEQTWRAIDLVDYYLNKLGFWYIFNSYWGSSPKPVVLDERVLTKWLKNTFYTPNTIVADSLTALGWDFDYTGAKFYYAARFNNAPQVDPTFSYKNPSGALKTTRAVGRALDYWPTVLGTRRVEVTSYGWNPYPFGIYAQGPARGTGTFIDIPKDAIVGTTHWHIIYQCKAPQISNQTIFAAIFNHELSRITSGRLVIGSTSAAVDVTPWVFLKLKDGSGRWTNNLARFVMGGAADGGHFPILTAYFHFIVGGFGGIGNPWRGANSGEFFKSWTNAPDAARGWASGNRYAVVIQQRADNSFFFPEDQSFTTGGVQRADGIFWAAFNNFFFNFIARADINWAVEQWRYPIFNNIGGGASLANPCDDLMQAMVTGNFDIVNHSLWGASNASSKLSRYSARPLVYDRSMPGDGGTFPYGKATNLGAAPAFIIRLQMPNSCGDLCVEFADFRVTTPGQLGDGSGDQAEWRELMEYYYSKFMFLADPFQPDTVNAPLSGEYAPWFPDVELQRSRATSNSWNQRDNLLIGKSMYNFDVFQGKWTGNLQYTGRDSTGAWIAYPLRAATNNSGNILLSSPATCGAPPPKINPPHDTGDLDNIGGNIACVAPNGAGADWTLIPPGELFFPSAVDSFRTGVVGFQANGSVANIGSCQTRWMSQSRAIAWRFDAPLANRVILNQLAARGPVTAKKADGVHARAALLLLPIAAMVASIALLPALGVSVAAAIFAGGFILHIAVSAFIENKAAEERKQKQLAAYFQLVYSHVPAGRWEKASLGQLIKMFCSLHHWYRGEGLPSPTDFLGSGEWNSAPPFGAKSKWLDLSTRKQCVLGTPAAVNSLDGRVCIGWDSKVGGSAVDSPSAILWRGRQLLSTDAATYQTTFFEPSSNFWIDTFNSMPTVNDTEIAQWQRAEFAEVSSQWGPFPDGAYFDWARGSGIFMKLGKHVVGYSGLDVVRRLGKELENKPTIAPPILVDVYRAQWERVGFLGVRLGESGLPQQPNPEQCRVCGAYSSVILTAAQYDAFAVTKADDQYWFSRDSFYKADGDLWRAIAGFQSPSARYYDVRARKWVADIPSYGGYYGAYPFPVPYTGGPNGFFPDSGDGQWPALNPDALNMPWEYQMFNLSFGVRSAAIDAVFLNEFAIPRAEMDISRGANNYVDLLKANARNPLPAARNWEDAIAVAISLIGSSLAHPFLMKYSRIPNKVSDGPLMILISEANRPLSLARVQTGALDKAAYRQSGAVSFQRQGNAPQADGANLEIDHLMSRLANRLGYDTVQRIQHWCGNKGITMDVELINLRLAIPGNLIDNTLSTDIYQTWRSGFVNGTFVLRDPLDPASNVYDDLDEFDSRGAQIATLSTSAAATWTRPPWIGYNPGANLYGWPVEDYNNFMLTQRLAYCPVSAEETVLSNSYPEFNKYIWHALTTRE